MKLRRLLIVGALAAAAAAGAWWMRRGPWMDARLRAPIEQALIKATGRSVDIGGAGVGLSGWLWLRDVKVGPDPKGGPWDLSFTAKAVGLRLDVWGVIRGRADLSSLKAVRVVAPCLFVLRGAGGAPEALSGAAQASSPTAAPADLYWQGILAGLRLPPVEMGVERGEIWERTLGTGEAGDRLLAADLSASLEPSDQGGWRLRASGQPAGVGMASLSAVCGPGFSGLQMEAQVKDLTWPDWLPVPPGTGPIRGLLNGDFEARPVAGAWPEGLFVKGRGSIDGVALQPVGRPGITNLKARWSLQGANASLNQLEADYGGGRVSGQASANLEAGLFSATVTAQGPDLGVLALSAGAPPDLSLTGAADLDFWASGPFSAPAMRVDLSSQSALWREHPLNRVELQASGASGRWSGDGTLAWDGGQGSVSIAFSQGALNRAKLAVSSLPADWLEAWAGPGISGRLDGKGDYATGASAWELSLGGSKLEVRGQSVDRASLQASGNGRTAHLRLAANLPGRAGFNGEADAARQADGSWSLRPARLFRGSVPLLEAHGLWIPGRAGAASALSLHVRTEALDLSILSPTLAPKGWSGSVQGSGWVALNGGAWSGALRVSSASLARRKWSFPGGATVQFGPGGITLTSMVLRWGEVKGSAYAPHWAGPWKAELSLAKAQLAALAVLPGLEDALPGGVGGWASGDLAYASEPVPHIDADLDFNDPLPDLLPQASGTLSMRVEGQRWALRALDLAQPGGGVFHGEADLDLSGRSAWTGAAHWDHLRLHGLDLAGNARLSGGQGRPGQLTLDPWSMAATALPALNAAFTFGAGDLATVDGQWGPGMQWSVFKAHGAWAGQAEISNQDPGPLAGFLLGHNGNTALRLDGGITGAFASPGRPAYLKVELRDAGSPGSRLTAQGQWISGALQFAGMFRDLKLGRLAAAGRALGLHAPSVDGSASGSWRGGPGGTTVSAAVDSVTWDQNKMGPASLNGGWDSSTVWVANAVVGADSGPQLQVTDAVWHRTGGEAAGRAWAASGHVLLEDCPLAEWTVGADALVKVSGGHGKISWDGQFKSLQVGGRVWPDLGLGGDWDGVHYSVREASRRPAFSASGTFSGGDFTLGDAHAYSGGGEGHIMGWVHKDGAIAFDGSSSGLPASDLTGIMDWPQKWTGTAWGTLKVTGNTDHAHTVISAKVEDGSVQGLPFDLATGYVVQDGNWVYLSPVDPIRLTRGDGTALEVGGRVTLLDDPPPGEGMDVWAKSIQGGLRLFSGLPAIRRADGPLQLNLRFTGKPGDPLVNGSLEVSDGRIEPSWLLPTLEKVELLAQVDDSKVTLQNAEAKVVEGGGLLKLEAADPSRPAFVFKDWLPAQMNLRIRSSRSGLPVHNTSTLTFVSGVIHPDLVLSGSWSQPTLGGTLTLDKGGADKAVVQWPPQFQTPQDSGEPGWFDRLNYDLALTARSDVMVRTGAAEVFVDTGAAGVRVEGAGADRNLFGQIRVVQGSVDYLLATFQVTQDHDSWVAMRGGEAPQLELWGVDDLGSVSVEGGAPQDVQVLLHAWGPLGHLQMLLSDENDPNLSQDQLGTLIGMGGDVGDPRAQGGFSRMLGEVPASFLTSWGRKTGLFDQFVMSSPYMDSAIAEATPGEGDTEEGAPIAVAGVGAPAAGSSSQPISQSPVSDTVKSLAEVSVGKYVGSKLFVGVNTQVMEHTDAITGGNSYDPEVGGVVEYQLPHSSKLSAQDSVDTDGQTDYRVMLEGSSSFDNYNPSRRRWDGVTTVTPTPAPTPPSVPSSALTPDFGP